MPPAVRPWIGLFRVVLTSAAIAGPWTLPSSLAAQAAAQIRPDAHLANATSALARGETARALALATEYLEAHPHDASARVLIARAHLDRDELAAAYAQLQAARRDHPDHVDVLYYLGIVSAQLAAVEFEALVERAPTSPRAHQLLAESLEAQERRAEAEREYAKAIAAQPDLVEALLGLARLKRIRLDCDGAVALYAKAETLRPTFHGAYGLGSCALRREDHGAALAHFERAVARDPRAAIAHVGLGSALMGTGRAMEAIASLERAVALEPTMGEAHYLLGRAYQVTGERERSKAAFARAEQLRRGETPPERRQP